MNKYKVLGSMMSLLLASSALAHGFGIYEHSARGDALGGAVTARVDDASALIYNPAAMTKVDGRQFIFGTAFLAPMGTVETAASNPGFGIPQGEFISTNNEESYFLIPHMYLTHQVSDEVWLGLSLASRFGLSSTWDDSWIGRFSSTEMGTETISLQPTIGLKLTDDLSVAVGAELMYAKFFANATIGQNPYDVSKDLAYLDYEGEGFGFGAVFAAHYKLNDNLQFGLTGRAPVKIDYNDGEADIIHTNYGKQLAALGAHIPQEGTFDADSHMKLPGSVSFGAAYQFNDKLSLEADLTYTFWSSLDTITINVDSDGMSEVAVDLNWENNLRIGLGAEYSLNENWALRAGYVWDESPIQNDSDFSNYPGDRHILTFGVGYETEKWGIDLSYGYLFAEDDKNTVYDTLGFEYETNYKDMDTHIANLTFTYNF